MMEFISASRWYGQVIGLNDITCSIKPGLTALLGQNGAGKSTLLRLATGQLRPTTGEVKIFGEAPFANCNVLKRIGYCPEVDNFYEGNSAREFVQFLAEISGLPPKKAADRTAEVLHSVGIIGYEDKKIAGYSKGMRQRVKLAQAMILDPDIILLDEPLNGLDPITRREVIDLLHDLAQKGKTIVVSSHILYEVESMTRSIVLLHRGRLLAEGDLRVIRSLIDKYPHRVRIQTGQARQLAAKLTTLANIVSIQFDKQLRTVDLEVNEPDAFYDILGKLTVEGGYEITGYSSPDNNLESVFEYLVKM